MKEEEVLFCKGCQKETTHTLIEEDPSKYAYECQECLLVKRMSKPVPPPFK